MWISDELELRQWSVDRAIQILEPHSYTEADVTRVAGILLIFIKNATKVACI